MNQLIMDLFQNVAIIVLSVGLFAESKMRRQR